MATQNIVLTKEDGWVNIAGTHISNHLETTVEFAESDSAPAEGVHGHQLPKYEYLVVTSGATIWYRVLAGSTVLVVT